MGKNGPDVSRDTVKAGGTRDFYTLLAAAGDLSFACRAEDVLALDSEDLHANPEVRDEVLRRE